MRYSFLISIAVAVILPILLIAFFAGPEILLSFLIWFMLVILVVIIVFTLLGSTGKSMLAKIATFENGLWITSLLVKFIAIFNSLSFFVGGTFIYLMLGETFKKIYGIGVFSVMVIIAISFIILSGSFVFWVSGQILKQTKMGYFLGLVISFPYIFLLFGIYPIWFLIRYRGLYFANREI